MTVPRETPRIPATDPQRDAFGRWIVPPDRRSHADRIDVMRRLAGALQALDEPDFQWAGRRLAQWLRDGGDLADALGVRPPQGSKATAAALFRRERVDSLLVQLSAALGSQARACRVLRGIETAPASAAHLVEELRKLRAPISRRTISRAKSAPCHGV